MRHQSHRCSVRPWPTTRGFASNLLVFRRMPLLSHRHSFLQASAVVTPQEPSMCALRPHPDRHLDCSSSVSSCPPAVLHQGLPVCCHQGPSATHDLAPSAARLPKRYCSPGPPHEPQQTLQHSGRTGNSTLKHPMPISLWWL